MTQEIAILHETGIATCYTATTGHGRRSPRLARRRSGEVMLLVITRSRSAAFFPSGKIAAVKVFIFGPVQVPLPVVMTTVLTTAITEGLTPSRLCKALGRLIGHAASTSGVCLLVGPEIAVPINRSPTMVTRRERRATARAPGGKVCYPPPSKRRYGNLLVYSGLPYPKVISIYGRHEATTTRVAASRCLSVIFLRAKKAISRARATHVLRGEVAKEMHFSPCQTALKSRGRVSSIARADEASPRSGSLTTEEAALRGH